MPVRHGSRPRRTEVERTDLSISRQRAEKFEGAISVALRAVPVLSCYGEVYLPTPSLGFRRKAS